MVNWLTELYSLYFKIAQPRIPGLYWGQAFYLREALIAKSLLIRWWALSIIAIVSVHEVRVLVRCHLRCHRCREEVGQWQTYGNSQPSPWISECWGCGCLRTTMSHPPLPSCMLSHIRGWWVQPLLCRLRTSPRLKVILVVSSVVVGNQCVQQRAEHTALGEPVFRMMVEDLLLIMTLTCRSENPGPSRTGLRKFLVLLVWTPVSAGCWC